jgi:hypothetical protein
VREPGGELADRQQLLAIALDPLDRVADGLEHGQERPSSDGCEKARRRSSSPSSSNTSASATANVVPR